MKEILERIIGDRYLIKEYLGKGGFGRTYLAEDTQSPDKLICVVKYLMPVIWQNGTEIPAPKDSEHFAISKRLFKREARVLKDIGDSQENHGFVPKLFGYFQEEKDFFLVQELIKGHNLKAEISNQKHTEEQAFNLLKEILEPLSFIHKKNVIHRDLKPENLMRRSKDKKIVLIDFGAVKEMVNRTSNESGQSITVAIGSPGYMPREQSIGKPNLSSDVYALGMIVIEAMTGLSPIDMSRLVGNTPNGSINWDKLITIDSKFKEILDKMVCEDCSLRYQSATEIVTAIDEYKNRRLRSTLIIDNPPENNNSKAKQIVEITVAGIGLLTAVISLIAVVGNPFKPGEEVVDESPINVISLDGKLIESTLNQKDKCPNLMTNEVLLCQKYSFVGKNGQNISIEMDSDDFDPLLILRDPEGNVVEINENISPKNLNSKITADLTVDGEYTIVAKTTVSEESGDYSIRAVAK